MSLALRPGQAPRRRRSPWERGTLRRTVADPSVVGGAVVGAGFYLYRLSQGTEVVWNRNGDWRPWDKVKQDQNVSATTLYFAEKSN